MNFAEKTWIDYFIAYEDWAKDKESLYCLYLAYKEHNDGSFKQYRKSHNEVAIKAKIAWKLRLEARKKGIVTGAYEQVLRKYALLNVYYKESRKDWLFLSKKNRERYKRLRDKHCIKEIWKLRKTIIKLRDKQHNIN